MMRLPLSILVAVALAVTPGCYRTRYVHFEPAATTEPTTPFTPATSGWRHFFLYGWVPDELRIDAASQCGGPEHVHSIETEQTFLQGLIATFATYYINIYAPWTGRVVCDAPPTNHAVD